jgi:myo-inositol-1(or 4)-monophosphatase
MQEKVDAVLQLAIEAARSAGQLIQEAASDLNRLQIEEKSLNDFVSQVDRNSEAIIANLVRERFPEHTFIGEEYGRVGDHDAEYTWIVDPLDGTTNFIRGIPHYAVSIAVLLNGAVTHGVIFDPAKQELYTASLGNGTFLNSKPIQISDAASISGSLLATGVPFSGQLLADLESFTNTLQALLAYQTSGIRRLGAAALDLAYVAAGRYDGFWEAGLKPWDIAAGALIVQEAGGQVCDFVGGTDFLSSGNIVAACPTLIDDMIKVTSGCYR